MRVINNKGLRACLRQPDDPALIFWILLFNEKLVLGSRLCAPRFLGPPHNPGGSPPSESERGGLRFAVFLFF